MAPVIYIATEDEMFAEAFGGTIGRWGMTVLGNAPEGMSLEELLRSEVDLILLDIRSGQGRMLRFLREVKGALPAIQVLLINRADNVVASIEAMKAGADDEVMAPCESGALRKKLKEALRRRKKSLCLRRGRSLIEMFNDTMAAAAFAQAGEFETAVEIFEGKETGRPAAGGNEEGKKEGRTGPLKED